MIVVWRAIWDKNLPPTYGGPQTFWVGWPNYWSDEIARAVIFESPEQALKEMKQYNIAELTVIMPAEDAALWDELRRL